MEFLCFSDQYDLRPKLVFNVKRVESLRIGRKFYNFMVLKGILLQVTKASIPRSMNQVEEISPQYSLYVLTQKYYLMKVHHIITHIIIQKTTRLLCMEHFINFMQSLSFSFLNTPEHWQEEGRSSDCKPKESLI